MNQAYKLVWDELRGMLVVVAENSGRRCKKAGKGGRKVAASVFALALAGAVTALPAGDAWAAVCAQNAGTGYDNGQPGSIVCGTDATAGNVRTVVIGSSQVSDFPNKKTQATGMEGIAIGFDAQSLGGQSIVLGSQAKADGPQSIAIGANVRAQGASSVAIGGDDVGKQGQSGQLGDAWVAVNSLKEDLVEQGLTVPGMVQRVTNGDWYADTTRSRGDGSVAIGAKATSTGPLSSAIGMGAESLGKASTALGTTALAVGEFSSALGAAATAAGTRSSSYGMGTAAVGTDAVALGTGAYVGADDVVKKINDLALAYQKELSAYDKLEKDGATSAQLQDRYANYVVPAKNALEVEISKYATTYGRGVAVGAKSQALVADGVALGSGSVANRATANVAGYDVRTGSAYVKGDDDANKWDAEGSVWKSTLAAVSVGSAGDGTTELRKVGDNYYLFTTDPNGISTKGDQVYVRLVDGFDSNNDPIYRYDAYKEENYLAGATPYSSSGEDLSAKIVRTRQITNVAAGSLDTDAVNVAQLKLVRESSWKIGGDTLQEITGPFDPTKDHFDYYDGAKYYTYVNPINIQQGDVVNFVDGQGTTAVTNPTTEVKVYDANGNPVYGASGKPVTVTVNQPSVAYDVNKTGLSVVSTTPDPDYPNAQPGQAKYAPVWADDAGNKLVKQGDKYYYPKADGTPDTAKEYTGTRTNIGGDYYATAGDVANTINNVYWNVQGFNKPGSADAQQAADPYKVHASNNVKLVAGPGVKLGQKHNTNEDGDTEEGTTTITLTGWTITGTEANTADPSSPIIKSIKDEDGNPYTISGGTSSGSGTTWHIYQGDDLKGDVNDGTNVKFKSGDGTSVAVDYTAGTSSNPGGSTTVTYNVNQAKAPDEDATKPGKINNKPKVIVVKSDGSTEEVDWDNAPNAPNYYWNAQQTADAINMSSWTAKATKTDDGSAPDKKGYQVHPGDEVEFTSSNESISVTRDGNTFDFQGMYASVTNGDNVTRLYDPKTGREYNISGGGTGGSGWNIVKVDDGNNQDGLPTSVPDSGSVVFIDGKGTQAVINSNYTYKDAAGITQTAPSVTFDVSRADDRTATGGKIDAPTINGGDAWDVNKPHYWDAQQTADAINAAGWNASVTGGTPTTITPGGNVEFTSSNNSVRITQSDITGGTKFDFSTNAGAFTGWSIGTGDLTAGGETITSNHGPQQMQGNDQLNFVDGTGTTAKVQKVIDPSSCSTTYEATFNVKPGDVTVNRVGPGEAANITKTDGDAFTTATTVAKALEDAAQVYTGDNYAGGLAKTATYNGRTTETVGPHAGGTLPIRGWSAEYDSPPNGFSYSARNLQVLPRPSHGDLVVQMSNNPTFTNQQGQPTVKISGDQGTVTAGGVTMGRQAGGGANPATGNYVTGLDNKKWETGNIQSGRAATEDQLQQVAESMDLSFSGDRNIMVGRSGNHVSIRLNPNVHVDSVTVNDGVYVVDGPSMTKQGINAAGTTITNVAPGIEETDAVNVGQLRRLEHKVNKMGDRADAGIAGAMAAAAVPQVTVPGANLLGAGAGYFHDQSAVAVGYSAMSDNGKWILKANASVSTEEAAASAGVGYQW